MALMDEIFQETLREDLQNSYPESVVRINSRIVPAAVIGNNKTRRLFKGTLRKTTLRFL